MVRAKDKLTLTSMETRYKDYTCRICGGDEFILARTGVRGHPTQEVAECTTCGVQFLWPIPDGDMKAYYDGYYRHKYSCEVGKQLSSEDRFLKRHYELSDNLKVTLQYADPDSHVLEVGCAAGAFLDMLKPMVGSVTGLDYNSADAEYASEKLGITTYTDDLWNTDAKYNSFDLICSFHVIEHVQDPVRWLYRMRPYLKLNGVIVLCTPNLDHPYMSLWDMKEFADFWYREPHIWYFNEDSLKQAAGHAGYRGEAFVSQVYNVDNMLHWKLTGKPQPNASMAQTQSPSLFPSALMGMENPVARELNEAYADFHERWRSILERNTYGDVLYYVGHRFERG